MFLMSELWQFSDQTQAFRVLKPWWDVLTDLLSLSMLFVAVLGCTLQIMDQRMHCLPQRSTVCPLTGEKIDISPNQTFSSNDSSFLPPPNDQDLKGVDNNLDLPQYKFINQLCYQAVLHWFPKCVPHLILVQTIIFLVCSNFWFKFPGSSSKIEHFISIMGKCFDSPWTTRALSEVSGEREADAENPIFPLDTSLSVHSLPGRKVVDKPANVLDRRECEQAKALFERIKKFRLHVEEGNLLYKTYACQSLIKVLMTIVVIAVNSIHIWEIHVVIICDIDIKAMTGYRRFCCIHTMAKLFFRLTICYLCLLLLYGFACLYTTFWLFRRSLKEYSFEIVRRETGVSDIPDVRNDFAFVLHMMDQYDELYSRRIAVFLSEVSECKLRQLNLNHTWPTDKLRICLQTNSCNRVELQLRKLPGLPDTVFDLPELQSLRLELINNATIPPAIEQLEDLKELSLSRCSLKLDPVALSFLRAHLRVLRVKFVDAHELPYWLYVLRNLEELYLIGCLGPSALKNITLESLRELRCLKTLSLKCNLTKIPQAVLDLSNNLQHLCLYNRGTKLMMPNSLKKMMSLTELELVHCELECIPHAIFSLVHLQMLDLRENKLRSIEEIVSFQHLPKFTCLKLWHNSITQIPEHIKKLVALEKLFISHNKIEILPAQLFLCSRLCFLDVSHNDIRTIPPDIRNLQSLHFFSASSNKLKTVPDELFACRKLRTLRLGNNLLSALSPKISNLQLLTTLDLKCNHFVTLPPELGACPALRRRALTVEDMLFNTLPLEAREHLNAT